MATENWKKPYYRALEESILQPREENKPEREKWVVGCLLKVLHIPFGNEELIVGDESVDIAFRCARFQIKALQEEEYKRGVELKNHKKLIDQAKSPRDLVESNTPWGISREEIVFKVEEEVQRYSKKYGEPASLDFLFYFNYSNNEILGPFNKVLANGEGFRSVSLVTNSYCGVLYAGPYSPDFLGANLGKILS